MEELVEERDDTLQRERVARTELPDIPEPAV